MNHDCVPKRICWGHPSDPEHLCRRYFPDDPAGTGAYNRMAQNGIRTIKTFLELDETTALTFRNLGPHNWHIVAQVQQLVRSRKVL